MKKIGLIILLALSFLLLINCNKDENKNICRNIDRKRFL